MNHFHLSCKMFCVSGEARKVWPEVPGVISVTSSLHLSALHWLSLSAVNMCPVLHCHNYHNLKLVTRYNLWPNYSQYQFSVLFLTFFWWHCGQKFHLIGTQGAKTKDVRRMMQCCPITKSVAFLSAVFCPVTLFVAVAESRLSVRISANFSQDGEICSSSRRMDKQLAHTEIAQQRGAVGYVKVQWLYSLCLSVVLCNTV